ncbi:MAG: hypothetical protein V3W41_22935 [Planctomycetota bacterium]
MSHLFALHPGHAIDPLRRPKAAAAARATIDYRLVHGGAVTGWSRAWMINFMARLHDGDEAHQHLVALLKKSTSNNLFNQHPPFQIDGNFAATAGIAEMLLQSGGGVVELLSALPKAWPSGSFRGLRARGGFELDARWESGELVEANIRATKSGLMRLRARPHWRIRGPECPQDGVSEDGDCLEVHARSGRSYRTETKPR